MRNATFCIALFVMWIALGSASRAADRPPNLVIIFVDDMGYGDLGCYGAKGYQTPNLDRMASEGNRFTDFYVGQPICSASRAALLTGCYPNRVGILGALPPRSKVGISDHETLLPQVLKARGYATGMYGKWHLGDSPQFLPTHHGFDEYFGLPYSNDMMPRPGRVNYPALPLIQGDVAIGRNPDQTQLTTWYTERAVSFIQRHKDGPFFLYVAHNMPHVPLHVSSKYKGKTERGLYGDVIEEIDWSAGKILDAIQRNGIEDNTLVIFTSDNGPWLLYGDHAGSPGPLREGKMTTFDGGVRECCIMRWPGKIPAGSVCHEMAWSMDLLPTLAKLAGTSAPSDRIIDGKDIWPLITARSGAKTPHEAYYYYWNKNLQAVRSGNWKLHFAHDYIHPDPPGHGGEPGKTVTLKIGMSLFDLKHDVHEQHDVAAEHPEVVRRLESLAERARADLGDARTRRPGTNVREPAHLDDPTGPLDATGKASLPDPATLAAYRAEGDGEPHDDED
jgi:arylsulfatase A-like enzyme